MKYKDEQIDDILSCYYRVEVKNYVIKKYNISADTLNKYLNNPYFDEKRVNGRIALRSQLEKYRAILECYYSNGREKTIEKFKLKENIFDSRLENMKKAVFYNSLDYKKIIKKFEKCLLELEKLHNGKPDEEIFKQMVQVNRYLMVSDEEIKVKYKMD